jgi:hypothetical protein
MSMFSTVVNACSAGNLCAVAQRGARAEAEALLQVEPVDLVDDAVDIVVEIRPA